MYTVKAAGFLDKSTYVICYLSYKKDNKTKAYHIARIPKTTPKYDKYAHLLTNVCIADTSGRDLINFDAEAYKTNIKNMIAVVLEMYANGELEDSKWFNNAVNQEELINAILLYHDNRPFITKLMDSRRTVIEDSKVSFDDIYIRKTSQLHPVSRKGDFVVAECACGTSFNYHKKLLGMIDQCKNCDYSRYASALKVIRNLQKIQGIFLSGG